MFYKSNPVHVLQHAWESSLGGNISDKKWLVTYPEPDLIIQLKI